MNRSAWPLALSLVVVSLVIGIGVGSWMTPQYSVGMYDKVMDLGRADRLVDLRYINAMAAHHRGAMLLAEQAKASTRPEISGLAADILAGEPKLIAQLYAWKKDWYGDTRTARDPIPAKLGPVDDKFDLRFLNALIGHHEDGIRMTKEIRTKSSRAEILNDADGVEAFLSGGLVKLKEMRKTWYGV